MTDDYDHSDQEDLEAEADAILRMTEADLERLVRMRGQDPAQVAADFWRLLARHGIYREQ